MRSAVARKKLPETQPDPVNDPVGVKLRRVFNRKAKGRTDAEIAEAAGMKKQALSRLMLDAEADPHLSTLKAILNAVGATLADFDRA